MRLDGDLLGLLVDSINSNGYAVAVVLVERLLVVGAPRHARSPGWPCRSPSRVVELTEAINFVLRQPFGEDSQSRSTAPRSFARWRLPPAQVFRSAREWSPLPDRGQQSPGRREPRCMTVHFLRPGRRGREQNAQEAEQSWATPSPEDVPAAGHVHPTRLRCTRKMRRLKDAVPGFRERATEMLGHERGANLVASGPAMVGRLAVVPARHYEQIATLEVRARMMPSRISPPMGPLAG